MTTAEIEGVLEFLKSAERLKDTMRSAWTSEGRRESVAQHTWRLCLMALVFSRDYPDIDFARLISICIIHDLGEAIRGDIPAIEQDPEENKAIQERSDLLLLLRPLPERIRSDIVDAWDEYEAAKTPEARLAKALDKLETIMQHNQGSNPAGFDYRFNLDYGKRFTTGDPIIEAIREILDRQTLRRAEETDRANGP
jgi:putative hydrolase of HD superfamily